VLSLRSEKLGFILETLSALGLSIGADLERLLAKVFDISPV
jgi:hypothetical protein